MAQMTRFAGFGPATFYPYVYEKNVSSPGIYGQRVSQFDTWQNLYGGAIVYIRRAGSTALARVYTDPGLTVVADNPQTLLTQTLAGVAYGKFLQPLYTPDAYYLDIDSTDQTGIQRPGLYKLDAEDGDLILVTPQGGHVARSLETHLSQVVYAEDYGRIGDSPAENTATILAAVGAAGARGGGLVMLPPRSIDITSLNIPTGVYLHGYGRAATILRSAVAAAVVTIGGASAGLVSLTLDGVNVVPDSVGVLAEQQDDILLRDVEITRFETCLHILGGERARLDQVDITNGTYGAKLQGDTAPLRSLWWSGGRIAQHIASGLWCQVVDQLVEHITIEELAFSNNLTNGLVLEGVQFARVDAMTFADNARSIRVIDADDDELGFTSNIRFTRCRVLAGSIYLDQSMIDVLFDGCEFLGTVFELQTTMAKPVILRDCSEDAAVRLLGDGTRLLRWRSANRGTLVGITTNDTPVKAMAWNLEPGETVVITGRAVANGLDNEKHAVYTIAQGARRETADLDYDGGTIDIDLGDLVVGGSSGASAYVTARTGTTAAGTLSLRSIVGTFQNNEAIQIEGITRAIVNGSINDPTVSLLGSLETLYTFESDTVMGCAFAASGDEVQLQVTGADSVTTEWTVEGDVLRG